MTELKQIELALWNLIWLNTAIPEQNKNGIAKALHEAISKAYAIGKSENNNGNI